MASNTDEKTGDETASEETDILDKEPLVKLFSKPRAGRILSAMADSAVDMSGTTISERAGISRNTWYDLRDMLLDLNLIEETRKEGNAQLYQFNRDSEAGQAFLNLYDTLRDVQHNKSERK